MPKTDAISRVLPHLRRYARSLTGSQESGDNYIRQFLEIVLADRQLLDNEDDAKLLLFKLFHQACSGLSPVAISDDDAADPSMEDRIATLPSIERQILLLASVEGFSVTKIADITGLPDDEVQGKLLHARLELQRDEGSKVLVVEDEAVIAMDIVVTIMSVGHTVVAVADNLQRAVEAAKKYEPDLALVDVQLKDGDSGLEVARIMKANGIPSIFVTGFPEALLTGKRGEPAFVLTKPFDPHALAAMISQVLAGRPRQGARKEQRQARAIETPAGTLLPQSSVARTGRQPATRRKRAGTPELQSSS